MPNPTYSRPARLAPALLTSPPLQQCCSPPLPTAGAAAAMASKPPSERLELLVDKNAKLSAQVDVQRTEIVRLERK